MKPLATLALAAAMTMAAGAGLAQISPSSQGPIDVSADELEVRQADCAATWRGSAEAVQGQSRLRASTIRLYNAKNAEGRCGALERMEAEGGVIYVTPAQRVRGDRAVYSAAADTITLTGNVVVAQGQDVVQAGRLVIKVSTGQADMTSTGEGRSGRVRGVFTPNGKP